MKPKREWKPTKRQILFLRLIVASKCWCPGQRYADAAIPDGSGDIVPNISGGGDARILQTLVDRGLITKPQKRSWVFLKPTQAGIDLVASIQSQSA